MRMKREKRDKRNKRNKRTNRLVSTILVLAMIVSVSYVKPVSVQAAVALQEYPIVIVLDPGHGGVDGGATRTWGGKVYKEKTLNLAIAQYCKKELETYAGVKVYLTRSYDTYVSLEGRVAYAKKKGANLFVSLHNNADLKSSRRGACVFYPNANYKKAISKSGKAVAASIQEQLVDLGLKNNGIAYRNSENGTRYPDKKLADYYSVIRGSKQKGFPGIIVEHAFVSNPTDCKTFLGSQAKLKKLGVADATGIAEYYGLKKATATTTLTGAEYQQDGSVLLTWTVAEGMDGYSVYRKKKNESTYQRLASIEGGESTGYVDTSLTEAGEYEYCVRAYIVGNGVGRYTAYSNTMPVYAVMAPEQFAQVILEDGTAKLTWTPVAGASGYIIARRNNPEESFVAVAELADGGTVEWIDLECTAGSTCEYQICAYIKSGEMIYTGDYVGVQNPVAEEAISQNSL